MLKIITAKQLRDRLGEHLDRARLSGEAFLVTRNGHGKAVLMGASEYLDLLERLEQLPADARPPSPKHQRTREHVVRSKDELRALIK